jgi:hypothetical protein
MAQKSTFITCSKGLGVEKRHTQAFVLISLSKELTLKGSSIFLRKTLRGLNANSFILCDIITVMAATASKTIRLGLTKCRQSLRNDRFSLNRKFTQIRDF